MTKRGRKATKRSNVDDSDDDDDFDDELLLKALDTEVSTKPSSRQVVGKPPSAKVRKTNDTQTDVKEEDMKQ